MAALPKRDAEPNPFFRGGRFATLSNKKAEFTIKGGSTITASEIEAKTITIAELEYKIIEAGPFTTIRRKPVYQTVIFPVPAVVPDGDTLIVRHSGAVVTRMWLKKKGIRKRIQLWPKTH